MIIHGPCKRCGKQCSVYSYSDIESDTEAIDTETAKLCSTCEYYKMTGYNPDAIEPRWLRFLRWIMS